MPPPPLSNMLSRQRARQQSERVAIHEEEHDLEAAISEEQPPPVARESSTSSTTEGDEDSSSQASDETQSDEPMASPRMISLEDLEEERDLVRRRSSLCVLFVVFVLFKLWIEALMSQDLGMLLICLVGSTSTARWIQFNQEREEELSRQIANYVQNNPSNQGVDRNDFRMLSFQAQLALAILESQRTMMEAGGMAQHETATPGVSDQAKVRWKVFHFDGENKDALTKGGFDHLKESTADEGPHCSICLGEYENDEELCMLPCKHVYHQECITSWTQNHQKCPLCNFDLESVAEDGTTADLSTVV